MNKLILTTLFIFIFSTPAYTKQPKRKLVINDTEWKVKIPKWKDYYIESPDGKMVFKQPSCSAAADGIIGQLTERRNKLKATGRKYFFTVVSPIVQYSRSAYIYYSQQKGYEKYNQLLQEAKVVLSGKEHLHRTKLFDKLAQEVMSKDIKDSVTMKSYRMDSRGNYKVVPHSNVKRVKIRKVDRLLIAENLLKGDASSYFCSYDLDKAGNGEELFSKVKILKIKALAALFYSGPMKSRKFFAVAKKFNELNQYVRYMNEKKKVTSDPAGYFAHWKKEMQRSQAKKRRGYEKRIKVILIEAEDDLISTQFNKLIDTFNKDHWKKEGY